MIFSKRDFNNVLTKLTTYCPSNHVEIVNNALFESGAGRVGQLYDRCSFHSHGTGSFRPLEGSTPFLGNVGKDEVCQEASGGQHQFPS